MSELGFLLRARNHLALKSHAEGVVVLAFGYGILAEVPEVASGAVQRALCALPGIGEWTAQYVAMRALKNPDAFPAADLGLLRAFDGPGGQRLRPAQLEEMSQDWRPWRAYAALLLWGPAPGSGG